MRRHSLILMACLLLGLGACAASAEPYRVAVLPAWKNWGHVHDYDFALREAGCSFTNLVESAEQMDWLDKNLDAFDLLIAPPLFHFEKGKAADPNYARPYDMAKHAKRIAEWIQKGGCLLVTDANYASGLSWFQHLDPAMALTACVDPKDLKTEFKCNGMGPAVAKEPLDSILFFPSQAEYGFGWGHMVIPDESKTAWDVLARCGHGQPTMIVRRWGEGIVFVNSLRSYVPQFLENIRVNQQFLKLGITVLESHLPDPLPGTNTFSFTCSNRSAKPLDGELALTLVPLKPGEDGKTWIPSGRAKTFRQSGTIPAGTNGTIRLDCRVPMRGRVRATMTFSSGGLSATCYERDIVLPELFGVASSRYRGLVSKDRRFDTVSVGMHFNPNTEDPAKHTVRFSVVDAKGAEVAKAEAPAALRDTWVPVPLPRNLPAGVYTLRGELRLKGADTPVASDEAPLEIVASGPGFAIFDEDNALLSNGRPFFPLGIYHPGVPKELGGYSGEFARLADMGFNTINLFSWAGLGNVQTLNTLGVRAFWEQLPHRAPAACRAQGDELASNPATLLNYTMDEPPESQFDFVKSLDKAWHEADPYHPTVVVSYQPHHFARNAYLSDILAPDPYPWSAAKGDASNVRMVSEWMERARAASGGTRPYLCVPQAFGGEPPHVWRNMALQAIIHGAKGLIWYAWNEGNGSGMRWSEPLVAEAERLLPQLRALSPAFLNAKDRPRAFVEADGNLHGMVCRDPDGGAWVLLLANTLKEPVSHDLAIPELPQDLLAIAGAYGDKPLAASNGVVRVALDAFGSGIWCWGGAAPAVARSYKEFAVRALPKRGSGRQFRVVSAGGAVPSGAHTNLQMAVDAAKDGDTIRVGEGVWEPIVSDNKLLDIVATGPRDATVIDARNKRRAATLTQKPWGDMSFQTNTLLRGFTIRGGNASADAFRPDLGGGVLGGTLVDCTVSGNAASFGGGAAYANLFGCDLVRNRADRNGGGAAHSRLVNGRVDANQAAWDGGGLEFCEAERCVVAGNTATRDGGGAHFGSLTSSRVVSNTAGRHGGGAIRTRSTHTLFDRNNAKAGHGGGVYAGETDFCTIVNNAAQIGGGTAASTNGGWGVGTSLKHSILRGNKARLDPATSAFHVLGGGPGTWMDVTNNLPRGVRVEDPQFVNPGAGDYRLKPSSPCVDAGCDVFVPRSAVDPDGAPRVSGGAADAGAFEMPVGGITLLDADFSAAADFVGNNPATFLFQSTGSNPVQRKGGALLFDGDAAVRMHKPLKNLGADLPAWAYHRIDCEFRSDAKGGALLALPAGKDQGLWAEIDPASGKLRVVFTHGNPKDGNRAVFESAGRVADGAWHVLAVRTDRNGGLDAFAEVQLDGKPVPCIQSIVFTKQDVYRFPTVGNLLLGQRDEAPAFHGAVKSVKASCAAF